MHTPCAMELLDAWERGIHQTSVERALELLALACAGCAWEELARRSIGERNEALFVLREALFGSRIDVTTKCPGCGEALELTFHTLQMRAASPLSSGGHMTIAEEGWRVVVRAVNSADLIALSRDPRRTPSGRSLLAMCVVEASIGDVRADVDDLPEPVLAAIDRALAHADPQADLQLSLACPACDRAWSASFDIARFLWTEVHAWVSRTLRDVHALAQAYGWRERDVLELSPLRRQAYLELART